MSLERLGVWTGSEGSFSNCLPHVGIALGREIVIIVNIYETSLLCALYIVIYFIF